MAHIPDGVLSAPVLAGGALVSAGLIALALRRLREDELPQAAVLAAAFFVSSLISVPVGPSRVHLLLNGLMGLMLGWAAVPAIFVALLLQLLFFGYGGLVVLGVNTMNLALPAVCCALLLRPLLQRLLKPRPAATPTSGSTATARQRWRAFVIGVAGGALGVALTGALVMASLGLSGEAFIPAAKVIGLTYLPLLLIEGLLTGVVVAFLLRVEPSLLGLGAVRDG
jgi:cobalt/nickel transport system permease protein